MMNIIDTLYQFKPFDLPVGTAVMLAVAMGLADGVGDVITNVAGAFAPAGLAPFVGLAGNVGVAVLTQKVNMINRFLGSDLSDLVSVATMLSGVDNLTNAFGLPGISGGISMSIGKIAGFLPLPGGAVMGPPAPAVTAEAATSGYSLGEPAEAGAAVDDVDMALLSARGYNV